jgi:hypothetical protein
LAAGVGPTATFKAADGPNRHVVLASNLTAQSNPCQTAGCQDISFGDGHTRRFAVDKLDSACGASSLPTAGVKLIDTRFFLQREYEPLIPRYFELTNPFDGQLRHGYVFPLACRIVFIADVPVTEHLTL